MFIQRGLPLLLIVTFCASSCATIFSDSHYDYTFESEPSGATVTVLTKGNEIARITTPGSYRLDLGNNYNIKFELDGYETHVLRLEKDVDLWIIGSFLCTGLIGVAVDALSGAIFEPNTSIVKWRFERRKSALRGLKSGEAYAAGEEYEVTLEFTGNNDRRIVAGFTMRRGAGMVTHRLEDIIQNIN